MSIIAFLSQWGTQTNLNLKKKTSAVEVIWSMEVASQVWGR
jgi:hypothetical protein